MPRASVSKAAKPVEVSAEQTGAGASDETRRRLAAALEAILFTADKPVSDARLAEALELGPGGADAVRSAIASLNDAYESAGRAFRVERVAGGYRVMTTGDNAEHLAMFHQKRASTRLSRAAIETLAIIAYRQPLARSQIESIRGVASGEVLRALLERDLVAIVGRADELGRPMLYGTTRRFLEVFGLSSLKDLPPVEAAEDAFEAARETAQRSQADVSAGEESIPADNAQVDGSAASDADAPPAQADAIETTEQEPGAP